MEEDLKNIQHLVDTKFSTWEWNYGKSPKFNVAKTAKFPFGIIDARINVVKGDIDSIRIFGDFFVKKEISLLEQALTNVQYNKPALLDSLKGMEVSDFFNNMTNEEFVDFIL